MHNIVKFIVAALFALLITDAVMPIASHFGALVGSVPFGGAIFAGIIGLFAFGLILAASRIVASLGRGFGIAGIIIVFLPAMRFGMEKFSSLEMPAGATNLFASGWTSGVGFGIGCLFVLQSWIILSAMEARASHSRGLVFN